jgi:hypothetical protein
MAKAPDLSARVTVLEVEVALLKTTLGDLAAELSAAAATAVPVAPAAVDMTATNSALKAILERLDRPLTVTKRLRS